VHRPECENATVGYSKLSYNIERNESNGKRPKKCTEIKVQDCFKGRFTTGEAAWYIM